MKMPFRKYFRFLYVISSVVFFLGCTSYQTTVVPFKMPSAYPNATEVAGAVLAAQSYGDKGEARSGLRFRHHRGGRVACEGHF